MTDRGHALTVAIPTYNGARHVGEALRSILGQTEVPFDLIVSDDQSTDDTLDRVRDAAGDRARVEVNSERLGLAGNWNRCVARSRTPLVAVFHQDDLMRDGHLAAHRAAFGPATGMVASAAGVVDDRGEPVPSAVVEPGGCGPDDRRFPPGTFLAELAAANPLRCSAVTLRKAAHEAVGGFVPRLRYVVDWDFWIRVAASWEVAWLGHPTISVRWHRASETHTFKTGTTDLEEAQALIDTLLAARPELASFRQAGQRRLARAYLNRAYDAARSQQKSLCRLSLRRSIRLDAGTILRVLGDPRLAARLALGSFGRPRSASQT